MKFESKYNIGDTVHAIRGGEHQFCVLPNGPLTIGMIRVEHTDSPGLGETVFDNYKPKQSYEERYMCVETGIGTGTLFYVDDLYPTVEEAAAACEQKNAGKEA